MLKPLAPLPDRRRLIRTHVPGPLRWERHRDGSAGRGEMRTLSGGGISFVTPTELAVGDELWVEVRGSQPDAPLLRARMGILRVDDAPGGYCIAGSFLEGVRDPSS